MQLMDVNEWKIDFTADCIEVDFKNNLDNIAEIGRCRDVVSETLNPAIRPVSLNCRKLFRLRTGTIPPDFSEAALSYVDDGCSPHLIWMITEFLLTLTFRWKSVQGKDLYGVRESHMQIFY
jgi:hypothetical protein